MVALMKTWLVGLGRWPQYRWEPSATLRCGVHDGKRHLLGTVVNVSINANFISGNVSSPRTQPMVALNFMADALPLGRRTYQSERHASVNATKLYVLVGFWIKYRPLILNSPKPLTVLPMCLFLEDPNTPNTLDSLRYLYKRPTME
jgi:hypothetical protein